MKNEQQRHDISDAVGACWNRICQDNEGSGVE